MNFKKAQLTNSVKYAPSFAGNSRWHYQQFCIQLLGSSTAAAARFLSGHSGCGLQLPKRLSAECGMKDAAGQTLCSSLQRLRRGEACCIFMSHTLLELVAALFRTNHGYLWPLGQENLSLFETEIALDFKSTFPDLDRCCFLKSVLIAERFPLLLLLPHHHPQAAFSACWLCV